MSEHRVDVQSVLLIAGDAVAWVVGILLFLGAGGDTAKPTGELLVMIAATGAVIITLRTWQMRMHRAFVHGYHAGWHDASKRECAGLGDDCDVLDFSELQARRLSRLG